MQLNKIVRKERGPWGRRKLIFFNRFEYCYISRIKRQYRDLIGSLEGLAKLVDITTLPPAKGELRAMQIELVSFANDLQTKLRASGIHPFLIAGSLIGCVRHRGFIPWDDDIDFGLMRDEYEQLYEFLIDHAINIDERSIGCKNRKNLLSHLDSALKGSDGKILFLRTQTHIKVIKGSTLGTSQSVDFFPLEYLREGMTVVDYKGQAAKLARKRRCGKNISGAVKAIREFAKDCGIFSCKPTGQIYYGFDNLDATKREHVRFFNTSDIFPLAESKFEDFKFLTPNRPEEFLRTMLNADFMSLPPDIGLSHHVIEFKEFEGTL